MKILYIINNLSSGGAEKILKDLIYDLNKRFSEVKIELLLLNKNKSPYLFDLSTLNLKIYLSKLSIYNPLHIFRIVILLNKNHYDIVHCHLFPTSYFTIIAKKLALYKKTKFIYTEHSSNNRRRKYKLFRVFDTIIFQSFHEISFVSDASKINHLSWVKRENNLAKYPVIKNGVDTEFYFNAVPYNLHKHLGILDLNVKFITMVGRFTEAKDQNTLIKSLKLLPNELHLIFLGEGPLMHESIKLANELDISYRVHFLGFRSDSEKFIKGSFLTCLSSNWEGLSLFSIEAMASGIPFIGSNVPGIKEIGYKYIPLFEKGNSSELSEIVLKLFYDYQYYQDVSKRGIVRSNDFSLYKMTNKYYKVYINLIT
jgi:glycosyltransferase involved in cell wall biosynthesis